MKPFLPIMAFQMAKNSRLLIQFIFPCPLKVLGMSYMHKHVTAMYSVFKFCIIVLLFLSCRYYKIVSEPENYSAILSKLRDAGIKFEADNGLELVPVTPIEVDDEAMELNKELMSQLLELDDVDAVYTDQK
ncbi:hypothetical protein KSS87_008875 [Heliosperma pusillum]|nr:hypothetical protein KSS87_008875 [Heliosperma pusillum]